MDWWREGSEDEDKVIIEINKAKIKILADADKVNLIKKRTGKDLREQMTIEELLDLDREINLRSFGWERN